MNRHVLADQEERVGELRERAVATVHLVPRLRESVRAQRVDKALQGEVVGKEVAEEARGLVAVDTAHRIRLRADDPLELLVLRAQRDGLLAPRAETVESERLLEKRPQEETLVVGGGKAYVSDAGDERAVGLELALGSHGGVAHAVGEETRERTCERRRRQGS